MVVANGAISLEEIMSSGDESGILVISGEIMFLGDAVSALVTFDVCSTLDSVNSTVEMIASLLLIQAAPNITRMKMLLRNRLFNFWNILIIYFRVVNLDIQFSFIELLMSRIQRECGVSLWVLLILPRAS